MGKLDNLRIMHAAVGTAGTARLIADRVRGRRTRRQEVTVPGLAHPLVVTGELSDLEMLAEARTSPLVDRLTDHVDPATTDPVLDIGANVGTMATLLASRFPRATVTAYEPFERSRAILELNAGRYGGRIRVESAAVTATGGTAYLLNPDAAGDGDYCAVRFDSPAADETTGGPGTPARTLDEVHEALGWPERIAILKLDVEGGERELAAHGLGDLLSRTECFLVETHDRFRPGAAAAVDRAALDAGLHLVAEHRDDRLYAR